MVTERKWSRREFLKAIGAGGTALALAACAAPTPSPASAEKAISPQEKVKIQMWGDYTAGPWVEIIQEFMKLNPGIEVETLNVPATPEKLITAVTGGTPPDVFYMDRYLAGEWAARGIIMSLDDYVNASSIVKKERFYKRLLKDVTWRN